MTPRHPGAPARLDTPRETGALVTMDTAARSRRERHAHLLAAALDTLEQPVFVCTPRAIVEYANDAAAAEFGYSRAELIGMHERQLTVTPAGQVVEDVMHESVETTGRWSGERLQRRKDGTEFPAWITVTAIRDETGASEGAVVIVRDMTAERRASEQLRESERLAAIGELVAGVAHEVNNPLTGISAFAQLLETDSLSGEQLEAAKMIKREADRAVAVIRDLLTFARKTGPHIVPADLNDLIERTLRLRTFSLRRFRVEVVRALAPELRRIQGDERQLQQVLLNLLSNAEYAMAEVDRRVLTIRTSNEGDRVVLEVADSGTGMPPEVQRRIFEPFFTTKPEGYGTGLGLSVSYGIIQAHAGLITVHSAAGAGATVRLSFPAVRAAPHPPSRGAH